MVNKLLAHCSGTSSEPDENNTVSYGNIRSYKQMIPYINFECCTYSFTLNRNYSSVHIYRLLKNYKFKKLGVVIKRRGERSYESFDFTWIVRAAERAGNNGSNDRDDCNKHPHKH